MQPLNSSAQQTLTESIALGENLSAGMQTVLDTLASSLGQRASANKAALNSVTSTIKDAAKGLNAAVAADLGQVVSAIQSAAATNAVMSQTMLDDAIAHLSSAAGQSAAPSAFTPVGPTAPPPPGQLWDVWTGEQSGGCYRIPAGTPPRNRGDFMVSTGMTDASSAALVARLCIGGPVTPTPTPTPAPTNPQGPPPDLDPAGTGYTVWVSFLDGSCYFQLDNVPPRDLRDRWTVAGTSRDAAIAEVVRCNAPTNPVRPPVPGPTVPPPILPPDVSPAPPTVPPPAPVIRPPVPPRQAPPAPPIPPPPPVVPPPDNDCNVNCWPFTAIAPIAGGAAARIGSPEWCASMDSLKQSLSLIGGGLLHWIEGFAPGFENIDCNMPALLKDSVGQLPFGIGCFLQQVYALNVNVGNQFTGTVKNIVVASMNIVQATTCDNPFLTMTLIVMRSVLEALRKFRIGTDAGLWATLDISIRWDQADAAIDYLIKSSCPYLIPSEGEAMECYRKGWITFDQYKCWLEMNGRDVHVFDPVLQAGRPRPSVGERMTMLHRLRPGVDPDGIEFTDDDFLESLHRDGTAGEWQDRQYAIRYMAYTLREIRQLLDAGSIGRPETLTAFLDMGYDADKASAQADMEMVLTRRRREAEIQGFTPSRLAHLYERGQIDADELTRRMGELSYTVDQSNTLMSSAVQFNRADQARKWALKSEALFADNLEKHYKAGLITDEAAIAALKTQGCLDDAAHSIVNTWLMQVDWGFRQSAIATIRKGWNSGFLGTATAAAALARAGMGQRLVDLTIHEWLAELQLDQRVISAGQALSLMAQGMISPIEAAARLQNLGYNPADADILIQEAANKLRVAEHKQTVAQEKSVLAAEKSAATATKAAARLSDVEASRQAKAARDLLAQADRAAAKAKAELHRLTPLSTLNRWLKIGLIGTDLYTSQLSSMGYTDEIIAGYVADISSGKTAEVVQTGPITDLGTESSGGD